MPTKLFSTKVKDPTNWNTGSRTASGPPRGDSAGREDGTGSSADGGEGTRATSAPSLVSSGFATGSMLMTYPGTSIVSSVRTRVLSDLLSLVPFSHVPLLLMSVT